MQEALTNIARHAQAKRIVVGLDINEDGLVLTIRDDGIGFDPSYIRSAAHAETSIGLSGMEERVGLVGGQITIQSAPGKGTLIEATFRSPNRRRGPVHDDE